MNLLRISFTDFVLQVVNVLSVPALQKAQVLQLVIQFHLPLDFGICGCNGFDFGIGKRCLINVVCFSDRHVAFFYLRNKPLLVLQYLIGITVKCPFPNVGIDMYRLVDVALSDSSSVSLNKIARTVRRIQVMNCHKSLLHVRTCTALFGRANQHAHSALVYLVEKRLLLEIAVCFVNKGNLLSGDSPCYKFVFQVVIRVKVLAVLVVLKRFLRCRQVTEHELRSFHVF